MIKKKKELFDESGIESKIIMPGYNYRIDENDILVVFGNDENIEKSKDW